MIKKQFRDQYKANGSIDFDFEPSRNQFHEALGMMGIKDTKPTYVEPSRSLKLPSLKAPESFHKIADELMVSDPPFIGKQVS